MGDKGKKDKGKREIQKKIIPRLKRNGSKKRKKGNVNDISD